MTGQTGQTGQPAERGVLGSIMARFAPPQPAEVSPPQVAESPQGAEDPRPVIAETWDEARALDVQAVVKARLDAAVAAIPKDHPQRQARLNVLAIERGIIARLLAKHDPELWRWPRALEHLLERWREADRMTMRRTQPTTNSEKRGTPR